jgi:hypothetical protein
MQVCASVTLPPWLAHSSSQLQAAPAAGHKRDRSATGAAHETE